MSIYISGQEIINQNLSSINFMKETIAGTFVGLSILLGIILIAIILGLSYYKNYHREFIREKHPELINEFAEWRRTYRNFEE